MIQLIHGGSFDEMALVRHILNSGNDYIVQGQQTCALAEHTKPLSLDYWLRTFSANRDTKQADNSVIEALVETGLFRFEPNLVCPKTRRPCRGIRLTTQAVEAEENDRKQMRQSCNLDIEGLWGHLAVGQYFQTPDDERHAEFEIVEITPVKIKIAPQKLTIPAQAFVEALYYLREHRHGTETPCEIRSSDDPETAGPLCRAARAAMPNHQRCINYIIGIMAYHGLVQVDGTRPNRALVLPSPEAEINENNQQGSKR